jgi:hypothetical protein
VRDRHPAARRLEPLGTAVDGDRLAGADRDRGGEERVPAVEVPDAALGQRDDDVGLRRGLEVRDLALERRDGILHACEDAALLLLQELERAGVAHVRRLRDVPAESLVDGEGGGRGEEACHADERQQHEQRRRAMVVEDPAQSPRWGVVAPIVSGQRVAAVTHGDFLQ